MSQFVLPKSLLRAQVDELLRCSYDTSDSKLKEKLGGLIDQAYDGASKEEWEDVGERYARAFEGNGKRSDEGKTLRPNEVSGPALDRNIEGDNERVPFESLVTEGFFADYLEWTAEHESPGQYHFGSAITVVAAGLGRRPRIEWEARNLYPNLYTLLVGPSGARKGAAIDRALRLIVPAMGANQLPNEGTHQGFAAALRKRYEDTDTRADGLIVAPEFGVLMSRDRNKEDLVKWLTDWYDSPDRWERALRGEEDYELGNLYVGVLGGSTLDWLRDMPSDAITGGFMPRFILFDALCKRRWKSRPKFNEKLERELFNRLTRITASLPTVIRWSDGAGLLLDDWYERVIREQYEGCSDPQFHKWLERKQSAAMKLATVWQLSDGGPKDVLEVEWLTKAIAVVEWGDHTVKRVYGALGVTQEGQAAADVLERVKLMGGSATLRSLCSELKKKYTSSRIKGALNTLRAAGDIRPCESPSKGLKWELT